MRKVNFQSDLDFILSLKNLEGEEMGWIDYNWELKLTSSASDNFVYTASRQYGENVGCFNDNGKIHVVVDQHKFPVGQLAYELSVDIPDERFPDGSRHVVVSDLADVEFVADKGQQATDFALEITVPHIIKSEGGEGTNPEA